MHYLIAKFSGPSSCVTDVSSWHRAAARLKWPWNPSFMSASTNDTSNDE